MDKKKKVIIIAAIAVILALILVIVCDASKDTFFDDLVCETLDKYPYTMSLSVADDGSYMRYKINPSLPGFLEDLMWDDCLSSLEYINNELGFSPALYTKMINTSPSMGVQTDSNSKFKATWTYSSEDGLEIIYERN